MVGYSEIAPDLECFDPIQVFLQSGMELEMFLLIATDRNNKLSPKIMKLLTVKIFQKQEVTLSSVLLLCGNQSKCPKTTTKCY